jgi:hypothetical protein
VIPSPVEIDRFRKKVARTTYGGRYSGPRKRYRRRTFQCFGKRCRKFISRPSATCAYCGNDPLPLGTDPFVFDREYGWD